MANRQHGNPRRKTGGGTESTLSSFLHREPGRLSIVVNVQRHAMLAAVNSERHPCAKNQVMVRGMELRQGNLLTHAKGHAKPSWSAIFVMRQWNASDNESRRRKYRLLAVICSSAIDARIDFNLWPKKL